MASVNKKHKAKNSYMYNGGMKNDGTLKRLFFFTKRDRNKVKKSIKENLED